MRKLHLMSIREAAQTGILSEYALRMMIKRGELPAIFVGKKALINYDALCNMIAKRTGGEIENENMEDRIEVTQ
ncbi:MAG: excisionase family DNA-binding protein [Oscillospiraceae bacterium]|nr:excisionase family DNA-binding protein [Oscillospiraceae bacterium]